MSSQLKQAIIAGDHGALEKVISSMIRKDNWSLINVIDELLPLMLMESNLRYGSFHTVKMNLFLRRLALEGYFSKDTEREILKLIAFEMAERNWVGIYADGSSSAKHTVPSAVEGIIKSLDKGNAHNAFYYALRLMEEDRSAMSHLLLKIGVNAIPNSLGHSLSCFYPVVEDAVMADHPCADSALLTYIMYLARYDANEDMIDRGYGQVEEELDYGKFLRLCASGTGIVEVHHTITFQLATEWENAEFNPDGDVPYGILVDWLGDKEYDEDREQRSAKVSHSGEMPETYEEFSGKFSLDELNNSIPMVFGMLEEKPEKAVDWLFRVYASKYEGSWNPHYYTSLYCALRLFMGDAVDDKTACRMALDQALHYFRAGIG